MQVFQTENSKRWRKFQWLSRTLLVVAALSIAAIGLSLYKEYMPGIPRLSNKISLHTVANLKKWPDKDSLKATRNLGFKNFMQVKNKNPQSYKSTAAALDTGIAAPIRAAFYVAWDAQSYFSLRRNISKMNTILPEWLFVDPNGNLTSNIDQRGFSIIKQSGIRVLPMLSNNYKEVFRPEGIHKILNNKDLQAKFLNQLLGLIKANGFDGINIDFEELQEKGDESLIAFQKNLYTLFKANGLMVTQDVSPYNEDYNYNELQKYNDYLLLMAYDEHSSDTYPGAISSQKWIEGAVDMIAKNVPSNKIILCLAGYGYDWPGNGGEANDVTYQEALSTAREENVKPDFDDDSYNLHYQYNDDDGQVHQVYFTDAATNFNIMRFAVEYGLGGTAMWRLGSEDSRLWNFYKNDLSASALKNYDFHSFYNVPGSNDVDYIGEGEVLDVAANPDSGHIVPQIDSSEWLISEEDYTVLPSMFVVKKWGKPLTKKMVLTFDDGPDPVYTREILDTLAKYHVPAAFFLVGIQAEENIPLVQRIYREGHEVGNHTFTHPNMAEVSSTRSNLEMDATRLLIECITGHSTILFRAPFNADSEPETMQELIPVSDSRKKNYLTIGESIDPEDWQAGEIPNFNADTIFNRVVAEQALGNIILLHDAGGPREATVEALPRIIKYFRSQGYTFTTVADLLGKTRDEVMPAVPPGKIKYLYDVSRGIAETGYFSGHILYYMLLVFISLGVCRMLWMLAAAWFQSRREARFNLLPAPQHFPHLSIIVPAYNEEVNIVSSIANLLKCNYPNFDIIFVDDGSRDETFARATAAFGGNERIKLFSKPNGGKASALNFGISKSTSDYVLCIDADTRLQADAAGKMMKHFIYDDPAAPKIGAVAGNVKVGNEVNMLTRWQSIEYITSQNFERKAFAYINGITVVPGAIGTFSRKALEEAGGFAIDTLAEDCDITVRLLRLGYTIRNENQAIAYTEVPESRKEFLKQRFRWSFGVMQVFWKNKQTIFRKRFGSFGMVAMPDMLLFKYLIPLFAPAADVLMIIGLLTGNAHRIGFYYVVFLLVDAVCAGVALLIEKESLLKLLWLIPQRIIYRWLMIYILFKAFRKAIYGELQHWGVLKRTGKLTKTVG